MNKKPLNICIFENGLTPDDLIGNFGSYPSMIERWLAPFLPEARFTYISPVKGEPLPRPEEFDGYILSGSRYSAYEKTAWMLNLSAFLQNLRDIRRPVFGICFGHQIMADAYGGLTTKAVKGWGVGAQFYEYVADAVPKSAASFIFHQDQVTEMPPEASRVGGSSHCPNGVFIYNFPAISVQYHPEFTPEYIRALAEKFKGTLLPEEVSAKALESVETLRVDNNQIAAWAAAFFRASA
ncbi:type 1 glutamine amidotransferase [Pseudomonas cavernicola]|uniref:Type 1 glutamine amidotransferase n=1 Tax=Pseudomonas cavernicola TaxID=2320866 RepID=A0A418XEP0_9PSED|nr:type 1 glutamine amidotransferase [Pseudomonas cavernicola]RJG10996.1 type 1 glutamine amidotransferase [Pseudomonas cavernicola]